MKTRTLFAALLVAACSNELTAPKRTLLAVSASTIGGDLDADGYRVIVGSERRSAIGPQNTVILNGVSAGTHVLSLEEVAPNCSVAPASITVEVVPGATTTAAFTISCDLTGVEITSRTAGVDAPFAYTVKAAERTSSVSANGTVVVSRLQPGNHNVSIVLNDNCSVVGTGVVAVAVSNRKVTPVLFDVTCTRTEKSITFVRDTSASRISYPVAFSTVLAASANGTNIVPVVDGHSPAWSPDGERVAFSETYCDFYYYKTCGGGLMIIDPETRNASAVKYGANGIDPAWSPDGQTLAFAQYSANSISFTVLYIAPIDGSTSVAISPMAFSASEPSWSPDGKRLVFRCASTTFSPATHDICVINKDGTGFLRLTDDLFNDWHPAWSPDGKTIAFATMRYPDPQGSIALMAADGTGVTRLTNGSDPAWSPDGSKLVFAGSEGLFMINADGSNRARLTTGRHRDPDWRK